MVMSVLVGWVNGKTTSLLRRSLKRHARSALAPTVMEAIKGWDGYFVDRSGKVFSNKWGYLKELKQMKCRGGYYLVGLCRDSRRKMISVHRLVAETFIPNPDSMPLVNHINGIKTDNRVENLEWCTAKYNIQEYFRLRKERGWLQKRS